MTPDELKQKLQQKKALLLDGGLGTSLMHMGLKPGVPPEIWNREYPERVQAAHRAFIDAGSDIIHTKRYFLAYYIAHQFNIFSSVDQIITTVGPIRT